MCRLTFALALLALTSTAPGDAESWTVPTETCRGYWLVSIALNEEKHGPGKILHFIYDTGASSTYVDGDALERASSRSFDQGARVNLLNATAGDIKFNKLPMQVTSLRHLSMAMGRPVDGILAVDVFRKFLLTIDPQSETMTLSRGELPRPDGETVFSVRGKDKRPWLKVSIAGNREKLLVDSGAAGTSISVNRIGRFPLNGEPRVLNSSFRLNRVEMHATGRLDGNVPLAGITFIDPIVDEVPGTQLLGGELLRHFVMTLDQRNRRLQLRRIGPEEQQPRPHFELGMGYRLAPNGLAVADVFADTPAEAAGIEKGDIIVAFDGHRPEQRGCPAADEKVDDITLSIERDGVVIDKRLVMEPVIPVE